MLNALTFFWLSLVNAELQRPQPLNLLLLDRRFPYIS